MREKQNIDMDTISTRQASALTAEPPKDTKVKPIELSSQTPKEKLQEITDKLEKGIKDIFDSDKYKEYLTVMSKFHRYSVRNTILILMQKPNASMIAGYGAWQKNFKRQVKQGEKGIKIIAPSPYKVQTEKQLLDKLTQQPVFDSDGKPVMQKTDVTIPAYKVTTVFDVSQTDGEPLPSLGVDQLQGSVDNYKDFYAALENVSPVPIGFENIEGNANGYFHTVERHIAVQENMSELQTLKTMIHEVAHAKLHNISPDEVSELPPEERKDRHTKEVEAESIAYTVCMHYGLDTSDYTFGYVADWSSGKELPELQSSLTTIQQTANEIITGIDEHFAELTKDKEQAVPEKETQTSADVPTSNKTPRLTADEQKIKNAVMDKLKDQIAYSNDGMFSTYKMSEQSWHVMRTYNVKIEKNTVTRNGEPMFAIHRRYSSRKIKGCYRELNPTLEYIYAKKQEKPSIRKQLAYNKVKSEPKKSITPKKEDISL